MLVNKKELRVDNLFTAQFQKHTKSSTSSIAPERLDYFGSGTKTPMQDSLLALVAVPSDLRNSDLAKLLTLSPRC
jgi:hypothetical protein